MAKFSIYNIQLIKLTQGLHEFEFDLDNKFFENIDGDEIRKGNLKADVSVIKTGSTHEFNFRIKGVVRIPCTRCLDEMEQEIDSENRLIVKFGPEYYEESDEVIIIPEEEGEINIAWFLYEFIVLNIPIKHYHEPGKCNKAVVAKFRKHQAVSKDDEGDDNDEDDIDLSSDEVDDDDITGTDPRWDALKGLSFENN